MGLDLHFANLGDSSGWYHGPQALPGVWLHTGAPHIPLLCPCLLRASLRDLYPTRQVRIWLLPARQWQKQQPRCGKGRVWHTCLPDGRLPIRRTGPAPRQRPPRGHWHPLLAALSGNVPRQHHSRAPHRLDDAHAHRHWLLFHHHCCLHDRVWLRLHLRFPAHFGPPLHVQWRRPPPAQIPQLRRVYQSGLQRRVQHALAQIRV
mmetsp:Transcript_34706/g.84528  ORF Transcript_34706/g.84528 Transcript_34706/m.84528 type:complete len:204 (+) Transcript_34706:535-1146(+)